MSYFNGPRLVTDGLILCLDAGNRKSYPGTGTTWYDLGPNKANGTIVGTVPFVSAGAASYFNFATASDSNYISSTVTQAYVDMTLVFYPDFTLNRGGGIAGLIANSTPPASTDDSLRFLNVNGSSAWTVQNPGDLNDWAYTTATTFYVNTKKSNTLVSGWNIFGGYRTNQTNFSSPFAYFLGTSGYPDRGFQGRLAFVAMYNRQLTESEQLQNFNTLKGRFSL